MTILSNDWRTIHPSVYSHAGSLLHWVEATPRPHGALRYQCPVTESFVCVTDDETLEQLDRPYAPVRCPCCRQMHLLMRGGAEAAPVARGPTQS